MPLSTSWRFLVPLLVLLPLAAPALASQQSSTTMVTVDAPREGDVFANGQTIRFSGWAADSAGTGTGVDAVEIYVDGPRGSAGVRISARYGIERPDVAERMGRSGWRNSGFSADWTARGLEPGSHTFHVYAHSTQGDWVSSPVAVGVSSSPSLARDRSDSPYVNIREEYGPYPRGLWWNRAGPDYVGPFRPFEYSPYPPYWTAPRYSAPNPDDATCQTYPERCAIGPWEPYSPYPSGYPAYPYPHYPY